ncbi:MAG: CoA transferase [Hyphomicrobiaceae bacterium]|nr:CoA transferase [Hyphomicrobiaceae bacterium]
MSEEDGPQGPLRGLKVIDCATIYAGPLAAMVLGDFGADVIKIEHPDGDVIRKVGFSKDGAGLWWKVVGRNKRSIALDLHTDDGKETLKALVKDADVLVENFRTGTLERWGIGWDVLSALNPRLVMLRVTGFGQTGPYRHRAGFGTLAEAMSGFAHITGEANGPPTLPPFGLADGVAAYHGVFAIMFALWERDQQGTGKGQYIDLAIYEPLFSLLGAQATIYDQLGIMQSRTGNRSVINAPRNAYKTKEGRWVALSASAPSITRRVLELTGGKAFADDPRFKTARGRVDHVEEIDGTVGGWIARHTLDEVVDAFEKAEAAIAPIYDIGQIFEDPHFKARDTVTTVQDPQLGPIRMQNVFPQLSMTPGRIRHPGPDVGEHTDDILAELIAEGRLTADTAERIKAAFAKGPKD